MSGCIACLLPTTREPLCDACWQDLQWVGEVPAQNDGRLQLAALYHQHWARAWVHGLKYHGDIVAGRTLALLLATLVRDHYASIGSRLPQVLLPVPLHWRRQFWRGRNQAATLAQLTGRALAVPTQTRGLYRRRQGPSQQQLNRRARLANLSDCFRADTRAFAHYHHVAIVDDVYTTGATTQAVVAVLREAGIERIDCWCATYTPPAERASTPSRNGPPSPPEPTA